ncbi:MAG: hypothetical protein METHP_00813 [Methanoregula sp. SKADARSKE-2]|nr:MAG: hypothetical protein METHP_00813 [Methanoregula sp. SKADARSKE-2]
MTKRNRIESSGGLKKTKKERAHVNFLGIPIDSIGKGEVKRHLLLLIAASLVTKLLVVILTISVFHSFIDLFDIGFYFDHAMLLVQGQLPYINYSFDYPVLIFFPILIALIPTLLFQNAMAFLFTFSGLMVIFDIITLVCIYLIGLRIVNEKTAFYASMIYATAFSTSYFVLTKYDAFPTNLLMVAVLFTVYGMNVRGYIAATLGFFAKIFPALSFPFFILYNAKSTSLKRELISGMKVIIPFLLILFLPFALIRPAIINTYLFATGASVGVYVNTATFTLFAYLHNVVGLGVTASFVSFVMYILMELVLLTLLGVAFFDSERRPKTLVKLLLATIFSVIFFTKFHSPQYIVWLTPFLCLLVADNLTKIILFYIAQVFAYLEFPLMFGTFYTNLEYVSPVGTPSWDLTLIFFTLQYVVLVILLFVALEPADLLDVMKERVERMRK